MSDVFESAVVRDERNYIVCGMNNVADFGHNSILSSYAANAINSHDELVSKLDCAESTIYEVERVLSEMQRNGAFGLDDVIAEVECCIKRLSQ